MHSWDNPRTDMLTYGDDMKRETFRSVIENLQQLCSHCNRVKGDRPREYLVARLMEIGIAA